MVVVGSINLETQVAPVSGEAIGEMDLNPDPLPMITRDEIIYCAYIALGLLCSIGLASSAPLTLFASGALLPITCALAALSNGGSSLKQRYYIDQLEQLGLRAFIDRHGWDWLAEYTFDWVDLKVLSALFGPSDLGHPRLWEGIRLGFLKFSNDAPLLNALLEDQERLVELRENKQVWELLDAISDSLNGCEPIRKLVRGLSGEEVVERRELLERLEIMPSPLCVWAEEWANKRRAFQLTIESERVRLEHAHSTQKAAHEEYFGRARLKAIDQNDSAALRDLQEEQESALSELKQKFEDQMHQVQKRVEDFTELLEQEYENVRSAARAYFLFYELPLSGYVERFDVDTIRKAIDQWGFPTREIWSERLSLSPLDLNAPETLIGLELDLLTDSVRDALAKKEISQYASVWDILNDPGFEELRESKKLWGLLSH